MKRVTTIVWFRQDLRTADHPALVAAAARGSVVPLYIWAPEEEGPWPPGGASRWWLHHSLASLAERLARLGSPLCIRRGPTWETLQSVARESDATGVVWSRRYEPAAIERDKFVKANAISAGLRAESFNGSLLHEPWSIATRQGGPFQVFTPFWKACQAAGLDVAQLPEPQRLEPPGKTPASVSLDELQLLPNTPWDRGFYTTWAVGAAAAQQRLSEFAATCLIRYRVDRDRLDQEGFSRLAPHLHWGEISPRQVVAVVRQAGNQAPSHEGATTFLAEIGWREFAHHLLYHFPATAERPLRDSFGRFPWRRSASEERAWRRGQTGYPVVDAAMRQLWATGYMPNRARMIVASFFTKHLRLPWQHGAKWFWDTLVDADLANNTLGWQWTAGCGADAAPYFRIFNPVTQAEKFDPEGAWIRRWLPELAALPTPWIFKPWEAPDNALQQAGVRLGGTYPRPIVDHAQARNAALAAFDSIRGT